MTNKNPFKKISIIGAGAWGTTLGKILSEKGAPITIWAYEKETSQAINKSHENSLYLAGFRLSESLKATNSLKSAVKDTDLIILAVPSDHYQSTIKSISPFLTKSTAFLSLTKGLCPNGCAPLTTILVSELIKLEYYDESNINSCIIALSGPNLAGEIARKIPSSSVAACPDHKIAVHIQSLLMREYFRVYTSDDITGVQIGGALKNIIAIATGICAGLGFGKNTEAALMTRGLSEMLRLCPYLNARPETLAGLSGLGDLIATAGSPLSRNREFGFNIARGADPLKLLQKSPKVIEGAKVVVPVINFSAEKSIETPISAAVYNIIYNSMDPYDAVSALMSRKPKQED
jgi:glycerol-3-phosphate dehydrogenase (NAD(P)+)